MGISSDEPFAPPRTKKRKDFRLEVLLLLRAIGLFAKETRRSLFCGG